MLKQDSSRTQHESHPSRKRSRILAGILGAGILGAGIAATLGAGAAYADTPNSAAAPGAGDPTPHVYEGTIQGNPSISLDCGPGGYVQRTPGTGPNIFDSAHVDDSGSDPNITLVNVQPDGLVDWGHWGSALATKISGNITSGAFNQGKHYKITLYCTSSQDDAWVVLDTR
jgi:hypothetical protein